MRYSEDPRDERRIRGADILEFLGRVMAVISGVISIYKCASGG